VIAVNLLITFDDIHGKKGRGAIAFSCDKHSLAKGVMRMNVNAFNTDQLKKMDGLCEG
jgi:hypothetical protein